MGRVCVYDNQELFVFIYMEVLKQKKKQLQLPILMYERMYKDLFVYVKYLLSLICILCGWSDYVGTPF